MSVTTLQTNDSSLQKTEFISTEYVEHPPIVITSNADFVNQGYPGNGTKEDPYIIEGLYIASSGYCIEILHTTAHLLIRECNFSTGVDINSEPAIFIDNASNIRIEDSLFFNFHAIRLRNTTGCIIWNNIMCRRGGIYVQTSSDGIIEKNTFDTFNQNPNCAAGVIDISYSNNFTISKNTISHCYMAIHCYNDNDFEFIENTIFNNEQEGMTFNSMSQLLIFNNTIYSNGNTGIRLLEVINSTVYSNHIGGNSPNAFENGGENSLWDDGVSIGNMWDDYDGIGGYEINGNAGAVDNYPVLWDEDFWGPEIELGDTSFPDNYRITMTLSTGSSFDYMDHYFITVNVSDISGVDTVKFVRQTIRPYDSNWYSYSMRYDPLPDNPDRYTYNISFQEHGHELLFYILANDTLGNEENTESYFLGDRFIVGPTTGQTNETTPDLPTLIVQFLTNPLVFSVLLTGVIATIVLYKYRKSA